MSSAVAMNRKIAQQGNTSHNVSEVQQMQRGVQRGAQRGGPSKGRLQERPTAGLQGTPIQQCWQVLNFHEKRLNDMGGFLANTSKETSSHLATVTKRENILEHRIKLLEAQLESILPHLQKEAKEAAAAVVVDVSHNKGTRAAESTTKRRSKNNNATVRLEVNDR